MSNVPTDPSPGSMNWLLEIATGASLTVAGVISYLYKSNVSWLRDRIIQLEKSEEDRMKVISTLQTAQLECEKHRARLEEKCTHNDVRLSVLEKQLQGSK